MSSEIVADTFDARRVPLFIAGIGLLAVPFAFAQQNLAVLEGSPAFVLGFGVVALASIGFLAYFLVFRHLPAHIRRSPYLIFFAIAAFAAGIDLLIGLTVLGYTDVMAQYFESGEPYLNTSHGMAINLWDGTVHLALYIWMSFCLASSIPHRRLALFWAGSLIASCLVFMAGNLIGEYAELIEPSILLNLPFLIGPLFYAWKVAVEDKAAITRDVRRPLSAFDYVLVVALLFVAALSVFRMLVVLNPDITLTQQWANEVEPYLLSSSRYPQMQMLFWGLYLMPFSVLAAISLWRMPSTSISTWAWLLAGAAAQGQIAHLAASVSAAASDPQYAVDASQQAVFWVANIVVGIVPLWFAWRYDARM